MSAHIGRSRVTLIVLLVALTLAGAFLYGALFVSLPESLPVAATRSTDELGAVPDSEQDMTLHEARDAWLAGEVAAPTNSNPAPLLPEDQRTAWIIAFQRSAQCMRESGFASFPDAPSTFGDGRTRSPLILVPSEPAEQKAFTSALLGDCALDTSQLDLATFQAAMDAAVRDEHSADQLDEVQRSYLDEVERHG